MDENKAQRNRTKRKEQSIQKIVGLGAGKDSRRHFGEKIETLPCVFVCVCFWVVNKTKILCFPI